MANEPEREDPLDDDDDDDGADDAETVPLPPVEAKPASTKAAPAKRPVVKDDDDDDDGVEAAPLPPAWRPAKKTVSKKASSKPVPSRRRVAPADGLPPESVIDAPKKVTLYMLGALAFSICAMWSASRFACNAHPMQTRKPRDIGVSELARDPKGAALELAQRWAGYDYAGALEVAKGPLAEQIKKDQAQCEADKAGCEKKRSQLGDQVMASAVLVSREGERAKARIASHGGATGKDTYVLELERDGAIWKASSRGPDTGPAPAPVAPTTAAPPGSVAPAPAGSH